MLLRRLALLMIWLLLPVEFCAAANNPAKILREANRLSNLFNWADAGPLYAQAERSFAAAGDKRDALYAKFGRIRSGTSPVRQRARICLICAAYRRGRCPPIRDSFRRCIPKRSQAPPIASCPPRGSFASVLLLD